MWSDPQSCYKHTTTMDTGSLTGMRQDNQAAASPWPWRNAMMRFSDRGSSCSPSWAFGGGGSCLAIPDCAATADSELDHMMRCCGAFLR
jgi:hypothetical protein